MQVQPSLIKNSSVIESERTQDQVQVQSAFRDYVALTKPSIISLLLFVTLIPMFLAGKEAPSPLLIFWTMLGGFLAAGGANALNQYMDRDIDHVMVRTRKRPLPSGRMNPLQVLLFGLGLSLLSFIQLWWTVNLLTALLACSGIFYYVVIYTAWLKRSSTQNIVIGGAAGSIPPLVGWAAVSNEISLLPIFMFMIIFYWTPPHFWALALVREKEYKAAGVPMLPVVSGDRETHHQIVLYSIILFLISIAPVFLQLLGPIYLVLAVILNGMFLWRAIKIWGDPTHTHIWQLYKFSLLYLALLFLAMGIDHLFYTAPATLLNIHWALPV
ncbi:MAG: heme o synthase [Caldilineaceae bacterium]